MLKPTRNPQMYRFLRVNEETMQVKVCVRMPCCGAKYQVEHLEGKWLETCLFCLRPLTMDPRQAPIEQDNDKLHAAFTKVSRYVTV